MTLLEVAEELQRLASSVLREMRRGNSLPCLSNLYAMKPLQSMIATRLSQHFETDDGDEEVPSEIEENSSPIPGYL